MTRNELQFCILLRSGSLRIESSSLSVPTVRNLAESSSFFDFIHLQESSEKFREDRGKAIHREADFVERRVKTRYLKSQGSGLQNDVKCPSGCNLNCLLLGQESSIGSALLAQHEQ